ncbi:hypothetical protein L6164_007207 [Bauhinia variegata]|uniref:Uncharacterized protein n=1 Tax=Bauhinia variegata TaxID=167791 RepID=A0ACB9PD10_BAUVA|nr:hypothetical protein L6164_007207 [Bauhinia variegata]
MLIIFQAKVRSGVVGHVRCLIGKKATTRREAIASGEKMASAGRRAVVGLREGKLLDEYLIKARGNALAFYIQSLQRQVEHETCYTEAAVIQDIPISIHISWKRF